MTRDKRKCMHLGTGLCPRNEGWAAHKRPCDDCKHYIDRNGETGEAECGAYRPSNGTEGIDFMAQWCDRCSRDRVEGGCPIVALTLCLSVGHPKYPEEWVYNEKGEPCCTAFKETDNGRT